MADLLTIVPFGGLCNRLRATLSAGQLARSETAKNVQVCWSSDFECAAHFDELFESIDGEGFSVKHQTFWNARPLRRNLHLPYYLRRLRYGCQKIWIRPQNGEDIREIAARAKRVWVSSCHDMVGLSPADYQALRPLPALQAQIDALTQQFGTKTIGVHIRRTDHRDAIAKSPTEAFRQAIEREIDSDAATRFFLATDDIALKQQLQARYGEHIIAQPMDDCLRTTRRGIEQAVVDLYCLAATQKIYGSTTSTYTLTAANIGDIPLQEVAAQETK